MKIAKIEQFFPGKRMRLCKITTDNGLVGWGETTLEGRPMSTVAAVDEIAEYLIGKDPLRIEHHWQHIYRSAFFRSGVVRMTALSGLDQALWDIAGKHYGVPVYKLLGGEVRDRIRVYAHWGIRDLTDEGKAHSKEYLERLQKQGGYKAFKAGPGGKWRAHEPPSMIDEFVERAYLMREWVGPDVELCFDFHGKMTPGLAIEVCNEIKGMRPMFVEEPVPQENVDALKLVSDHVSFPIATGERLLTRWGFREVFEKQAVSLIQPDTSHVGGITELKKVANMAEVYYMHIMPHCAIGPVALTAGMHVDAVVPNFLIQELIPPSLGGPFSGPPGRAGGQMPSLIEREGLLKEPWQVINGHIELPTKPGLGIEINERVLKTDFVYEEELGGEYYYESDGSVADW